MKTLLRPQTRRVRRILAMVREGTRTGRYANARDFCAELEVTRRTILRDLDYLRDEERAPIAYDERRKGYYLTDTTWQLPPVELSRGEVFSLAVARKLLAAFRGTPLELDMQAALAKVAEALDGNVTVDVDGLTERFTVVGDDYAVQDPRIWTELARHIESRTRVRMRYERFDGKVGTYELAPYHLLAYHGDWYLLAGGAGRAGVATFALSRVQGLAGTDERFAAPQGFDARAYALKAFGIVAGGKPFRVRLRFSPRVAAYIRHRVWHPTQRLRSMRDGSVDLQFQTAGWKELVRWVLSWTPDVRILAPQALGDRVCAKLREGLAAARRRRPPRRATR